MNNRSLIPLLLLLLVTFGVLWFVSSKSSEPSWTGSWEFSYFYQNDSNLVYHGVLDIHGDNQATMRIWPPKSTREEKVSIESLQIEDLTLQAEIVHDLYKINEGHPREKMTLQLSNADSFAGTGACLAFCAEGTEDYLITWRGHRLNSKK